jgi:EAL domain-containing protein (putative c-di-GMP-specific phosphodiesterase class I)/GGDEF domain-containing protein/predicted transcriptional regulator
LQPLFQPILDARTGFPFGHEGLIRGPSDTVLHSPANLFKVARHTGQTASLEEACCQVLMQAFTRQEPRGRLFLNVGPEFFARPKDRLPFRMEEVLNFGLRPDQIVIELTESEPTFETGPLLRAAEHFRSLGFTIALDDLGEGFASLKLWSELRPDFVKIDKHFIQGVSFDPVKQQFLRSIRDLAAGTGARVVAEGIETEADLSVVQELGLEFLQGYLFARPAPTISLASPHPHLCKGTKEGSPFKGALAPPNRVTASHLMRVVEPVAPQTEVVQVAQRFGTDPALLTLPVVERGRPVGLLNRYAFLDLMARHYAMDLYGKKACLHFMEKQPLVVDHGASVQELSQLIVDSDPRHILFGFLVTQDGQYVGVGSGQELMREITRLQIQAARYANPLTLLPGNVPIHEHLDSLLELGQSFAVGYCDLDYFKPYNDVYGYRKGDEVIQWAAKLFHEACDPNSDFLGHIGGDDFVLVMRSPDYMSRLQGILEQFEAGRERFFHPTDIARGGYETEDRQGRIVFHPLLSISIGVLPVLPGIFATHREISSAASHAKKLAKGIEGCSLFVERRSSASRVANQLLPESCQAPTA